MKNFELEQMGLVEMNTVEMKESDGGFVPFLMYGVTFAYFAGVEAGLW